MIEMMGYSSYRFADFSTTKAIKSVALGLIETPVRLDKAWLLTILLLWHTGSNSPVLAQDAFP
jgi:hypothetical protein